MMYDLSDMLLDSVCENFAKDFCIYVHHLYWPVVFYFGGTSLSGFGIRVRQGYKMEKKTISLTSGAGKTGQPLVKE